MGIQKTYCVNNECPFKKCDKHPHRLKKIKNKSKYVKIANFDAICKKYLTYLLNEI